MYGEVSDQKERTASTFNPITSVFQAVDFEILTKSTSKLISPRHRKPFLFILISNVSLITAWGGLLMIYMNYFIEIERDKCLLRSACFRSVVCWTVMSCSLPGSEFQARGHEEPINLQKVRKVKYKGKISNYDDVFIYRKLLKSEKHKQICDKWHSYRHTFLE